MQIPAKPLAAFLVLSLISFRSFQNSSNTHSVHLASSPPSVEKAIAVINPTEGNQTKGFATFTQNGDEVEISVEVEGLNPSSEHAWHIHEFGDISAPDGKATGGHYNPEGHEHGLPEEAERHAGDLGNLTADADGKAISKFTVANISILGEHNPILGRGVIIHAKKDDGGQPTGNAGPRIGQGVIGVAQVPQP